MRPYRFRASLISAVMVAGIGASPVAAREPAAGAVPERPLTAEEQRASDRKVAAAERYLANAVGHDRLATLACVPNVQPAGGTTDGPTGATATDGRPASGIAPASACGAPQGFLPVEARDQIAGHYCGPAVGQVVANYSWAVRAGTNKYSQQQLAQWMGTDVNGQTTVFLLEQGLETATRGAPRRPANWDWVVTRLEDRDRDGTAADELHGYARANVSGSAMPLAISVKPHDPRSAFRLASWPRPVNSVGHYVAIYGWANAFDGTDLARLYYTDSSRDEGGSTGKFWDPTRHLAVLILEHTRLIVW